MRKLIGTFALVALVLPLLFDGPVAAAADKCAQRFKFCTHKCLRSSFYPDRCDWTCGGWLFDCRTFGPYSEWYGGRPIVR